MLCSLPRLADDRSPRCAHAAPCAHPQGRPRPLAISAKQIAISGGCDQWNMSAMSGLSNGAFVVGFPSRGSKEGFRLGSIAVLISVSREVRFTFGYRITRCVCASGQEIHTCDGLLRCRRGDVTAHWGPLAHGPNHACRAGEDLPLPCPITSIRERHCYPWKGPLHHE